MEYESASKGTQYEAMITVSASCCSLHFSPGGNMDEPEIQTNEFRILVIMLDSIWNKTEIKKSEG